MTISPLAPPDALRQLVVANRIFAHEGVLDAYGHVSIRHPERPDHYIMSRSLSPELVTEADVQLYTLDNQETSGDPRPQYAERPIHGGIYEARPDVVAICHNHSPSIVPFGVTGIPLRPIYHMAALVGTEVPVWDIADEFGDTDLLVRTMEQGRSLARTLGQRRVALMRGHGCVIAGHSILEVVLAGVYMELNARLQMQAMAMGNVRYLTDGEIRHASEMLLNPPSPDRAWTYFTRRVGMAG